MAACTPGLDTSTGTRKVNLRAEIDTSAPFGSVKEAVTRFGGSGSWLPYYKIREANELGSINIKKVEEQVVELEKDLIVKELETLDVLEEITTTKKIVQELKLQLHNEALRPSGLYPDNIMVELKQAKQNLGKTIDDLGVIQQSIECLNKSMKKEKGFVEKTRRRLTSNFAGVLSLGEELRQARADDCQIVLSKTGDTSQDVADKVRTAELRLVAARKMEEAAKAAEAVALAEIRSLKGNEPASLDKKRAKVNISNKSILKRLKDAREEVEESKVALEEAIKKVEVANRKQLATEEVLRKWIPQVSDNERNENEPSEKKEHQSSRPRIESATQVLQSSISMRDLLVRKQQSTAQDLYVEATSTYQSQNDEERDQAAAVSSICEEQNGDLCLRSRSERGAEAGDRKHLQSQRRKFGFIHISLPLIKLTKKKV